MISLLVFYSWYTLKFLRYPPRQRSKRLASDQVRYLKRLAVLLGFGSNALVLIYGKFDNEFVRVLLCSIACLFVFYSNHHYFNRLAVSQPTFLTCFRLWL